MMRTACATQPADVISAAQQNPVAGPVISESIAQNKALAALESAIGDLEAAISPALSEPSTGNGPGGPVPPATCELHARLRSSTDHIIDLHARVKSLVDRVQL